MNLQPQHFVLSTCSKTVVLPVVGRYRRTVRMALRLMLAIAALALTGRAAAATFTVTSTGTASGTAGTLAWAIAQANGTAGVDTINFAITGTAPFTIDMAAATLAITEGVTINGFSQTGAALGDLMNGTQHTLKILVKSTSTVFRASASGVTIRGLAIGGVTGSGHGIQVQTAGDNDLIEGCYIGLTTDGATASSVNQNGIRIEAGANVIIRNCVVANSAVQASNSYSAIYLSSTTTGALVENCLVGTTATGLTAAANGTGAANATVDLGGSKLMERTPSCVTTCAQATRAWAL